jgi:large subunit ribosomal protein L19
MSHKIIDHVNAKFLKKDPPQFRVGETVNVHLRIREGDKERIQAFNGVVIARKGRGTGETFTVRRIVANEGVERIFLVNSPSIIKVEVLRTGKVRRAKLYYLRDRVGKARRLREKRVSRGRRAAATPRAAGREDAEEGQRELAGAQV